MYYSSQSEGGQHPPPYFSQHPKNSNGKHYTFSMHNGGGVGGSRNFSSHNASLNRGQSTTFKADYDNPNYMPLSTPKRYQGWNWNSDSIPQTSPNPQPAAGLYCHLSYYGEEVDKEYLPDHHHPSIPSNESTANFDQSSNFVASSFRKSTIGNTSSVSLKRTIGQRFNDFSDKYTFHQQQEKFRTPYKRGGSHVKNEVLNSEETLELDDPVLVRNFQAAASCFQRQASQNEDLSLSSPPHDTSNLQDGWSGVTTLRTHRKVSLKNEGHHTIMFPKIQKSFRRHLDFKVRRDSANMTLDDIIKTGRGIKRRLSYSDHQVSKRISKSFNTNKSTWLSGDGKSVRIRRDTSLMRAQKQSHQNQSTEEYYELEDGELTGESKEQKYFPPSTQSSHYKRQKTGWTASWRNFNRVNVAKTEKRPVVIDGSNVAFAYGDDLHFECKGIDACVAHFMKKGFDDISVIVPKDRLKPGASKDVEILQELKRNKMLIVNWNGQFASGSDDRYFILDVALDKGAIIVSNLNFTEVARAYPKMRHSIWNRVVPFEFTSDSPKELVFPNIDPTGVYGPTWDDVLYN